MKDIHDLLKRLEDTQEGETICLNHNEAQLILKNNIDAFQAFAYQKHFEFRISSKGLAFLNFWISIFQDLYTGKKAEEEPVVFIKGMRTGKIYSAGYRKGLEDVVKSVGRYISEEQRKVTGNE